MNIIGISGSLRKDSLNTKLLHAVAALLPADAAFERLDPGSVPLYNQDLEASFPADITALKDKLKSADGIIIATPEYNRTMPGVLKNFIDWTSRPYGDSAWKGKKVLVMGATGGSIGTALSQYNLKQALLYLDAQLMGQPEIYVGQADQKFDASGALTDESTREFLKKAVDGFVRFAQKGR